MDPRKQDCMGLYLYGSGYFAREDQRLGILRGERTEATFCHECPGKRRCEGQHGRVVRDREPAETEEFDHEVKKAERRGLSRTLLAIARAKSGRPDPYMRLALENYHRGVRDRAGADADS